MEIIRLRELNKVSLARLKIFFEKFQVGGGETRNPFSGPNLGPDGGVGRFLGNDPALIELVGYLKAISNPHPWYSLLHQLIDLHKANCAVTEVPYLEIEWLLRKAMHKQEIGHENEPKCCRIHFFKNKVSGFRPIELMQRPPRSIEERERLQKQFTYLGFVVIRPPRRAARLQYRPQLHYASVGR
jgi:hypothetical protein